MERLQLFRVLVLAGMIGQTLAESPTAAALDGATGRLFRPDLEERCFELLKATEYAPKSAIGKSRFSIFWTEETEFVELVRMPNFSDLPAKTRLRLEGLGPAQRRALEAGEDFFAFKAVWDRVGAQEPLGPAKDFSSVVGLVSPTGEEGGRTADLRYGDRAMRVTLRRKGEVVKRLPVTAGRLLEGFWKVQVFGANQDGRFVATRLEVEEIPDPREGDDPELPRVLVIGDSISMNYHESAKQALAGVANYHRIEGNGFSSQHGVENAELWLGEYEREGFGWDVIQFNHGLHDLKQDYDADTDHFGAYAVPPQDYQRNLERLISILKRTGARLVWCTTTPVPNHNKGRYARRKGAAREYNEAAREVVSRHPELLVTDLYGLIEEAELFDDWRETQDVHFYRPEEREFLGQAVADGIRRALDR
jgi:acyl-CoA thioesterase-1